MILTFDKVIVVVPQATGASSNKSCFRSYPITPEAMDYKGIGLLVNTGNLPVFIKNRTLTINDDLEEKSTLSNVGAHLIRSNGIIESVHGGVRNQFRVKNGIFNAIVLSNMSDFFAAVVYKNFLALYRKRKTVTEKTIKEDLLNSIVLTDSNRGKRWSIEPFAFTLDSLEAYYKKEADRIELI